MLFSLLLVCLAIYLCDAAGDHKVAWGYRPNQGLDPLNWGKKFSMCNGKRQSPIDIVAPQYNATLTPLRLTNYDKMLPTLELSNVGHTVVCSINDTSVGLTWKNANYTIHSFHFHWGYYTQKGSEHQVDGKSYPLEMHIIHWKNKYNSFVNATKYADGLLVWGHFYEINTMNTPNKALQKIIDQFSYIKLKDQKRQMHESLKLESLIAENSVGHYTHYEGSLTTPACNEIVMWIVNEQINHVSNAQMMKFRELFSQNHTSSVKIFDNYRPVQRLEGRIPQTSTKPEYSIKTVKGAATANVVCFINIIVPLFIAAMM